jgi:hypothetical protein
MKESGARRRFKLERQARDLIAWANGRGTRQYSLIEPQPAKSADGLTYLFTIYGSSQLYRCNSSNRKSKKAPDKINLPEAW